MRRLATASSDPDTGAAVNRTLGRPACRRGTILVGWAGIEGQDFSTCEPPPDYR
jgi:hypothetical protein